MNDVRVNGVEPAIGQRSATSSNSTNSVSSSAQSASTSVNVNEAPAVQLNQTTEPLSTASSDTQVSAQETVEQAVTQLNDFVQSVQRDLLFELDDDSGQTIVTVVDRQTSEVVRQIPDEVAVRLAQDLQQDEPLTLISTRV